MQLRRVARSLNVRFKGKTIAVPVVRCESTTATESRVIDAEVIHGDEQVFWSEKRTFYRRYYSPYMPSWDRFAQTLILMSRSVPRVPQEVAFRLMAVFLKLLLIGRITDLAQMLLPAWTTVNLENLLITADSEKRSESKEKNE